MFAVAKIFWFFLNPANVLLILVVAGAFMLWSDRWRRLGGRMIGFCAVFVVLLAVLPLEKILLEPLENRFPIERSLPSKIDGIITLGGAVNQFVTAGRNQPQITGAGERLTAFIELSRRYHAARLVYAGGTGSISRQDLKEETVARKLFIRLGLDNRRVFFESRSRNTFEGAVATFNHLKPSTGEKWVLITSASHMPRAVGAFRRAGWTVIPYPVDFRTTGKGSWLDFDLNLLSGLNLLDAALHEWVGLLAYRIMDRTSSLFPGPKK